MSRALHTPLVVLVAALTVASVAVVGVAPADGATADQFISLSSSTTPNQPTTESEFTFTTTFRSADASGGEAELTKIEVRDGPGEDATELASRRFRDGQAPTLTPGSAVDQSFSLSLDEPGTRELYVTATFDVGVELVRTTYRTNLTVYRPAPGLQLSAEPTTAGERTNLSVDVANGLEGGIRDVDLSLAADGVDLDDESRVASSIAGGATTTFAFDATPETLGRKTVEVDLAYTTAEGTRRTVTRTVDVRFRSPSFDGDLGIAAEVAPAIPGADTTLNLTLSNGLDRAIRQMEVRVAADGATIKDGRRVATGFTSGSQRTFTFGVSRETAGEQPVEVVVSFTTADGIEGQVSETLTTTFDAPANPGEVRLTGVSATSQGGELEISATAANVGSTDVSSVLVSVGEGASVAATDYFVGNVEGGDFASFTLTADLAGNVSTVPVTVSYVVDDVRRSTTTEVRVERSVVAQPSRDGGGGSGSLPVIVGAVVLIVVLGAGLVYYRRG